MVAELTGFVQGQDRECPECGQVNPVPGCWSIRHQALFCNVDCLMATSYRENDKNAEHDKNQGVRPMARNQATDSGYSISLTGDGNMNPSRRPGRKSTGTYTDSPFGKGAMHIERNKKEDETMQTQTIAPDLPKPEGEGWEWDPKMGAWILPEGVDPVQMKTEPAKPKMTGAEARAAREAAKGQKPAKEPKAKAAKEPEGEPTPCLCGCGMVPGRGSRFIPGHDATLKSRFLKLYRLEDETERDAGIAALVPGQRVYWDDLIERGILKPAAPKPVKVTQAKAEQADEDEQAEKDAEESDGEDEEGDESDESESTDETESES